MIFEMTHYHLRGRLAQPRPLGACQAAVASALGYRDWSELKRSVGSAPPSAFDHEVTPAEREDRRLYQARALAKSLGLPQAVAASLAEGLALTASHATPSGPSVDTFIAGMAFLVTEELGAMTAFASAPNGTGRVRAKAVIRDDPETAWPSIRAGIDESEGDGPFPDLPSWYRPGGWLDAVEMLGWRVGSGVPEVLGSALHRHLGRRPSEAETGLAWRAWQGRLASSRILPLAARVDQSVFGLATQSGFEILDLQEGYEDFRDIPGNRLLRAVASAYPLLAAQAWAFARGHR